MIQGIQQPIAINAQPKHKFVERVKDDDEHALKEAKGKEFEVGDEKDTTQVVIKTGKDLTEISVIGPEVSQSIPSVHSIERPEDREVVDINSKAKYKEVPKLELSKVEAKESKDPLFAPRKEKKAHWTCCWPFSFCCGATKKVAQKPVHRKEPTVLDYDPTQVVAGQVPLNKNW